MTRPDLVPDGAPLDGLLHDAVDALKGPVAVRPAALSALKAAIRAEGAGAPRPASVTATQRPQKAAASRSRLPWFVRPRAIRISPLGLIAAAALLVIGGAAVQALMGGAPLSDARSVIATAPVSTDRAAQVVRFTLVAPGAERVSLVGDFNAWDPGVTTLRQQDGTWTVTIPVAPGRHQYGFVVDGSRWIADPAAPQSADSDFGTANSVMYVGS